jgi:hypothetical protein
MRKLQTNIFIIKEDKKVKESLPRPISIRKVKSTPNHISLEGDQSRCGNSLVETPASPSLNTCPSPNASPSEYYLGLSDLRPSQTPDLEIPEKIVASYTNDYNIFRIHDIVLRKLKNEQRSTHHLENKLQIELNRIANPQSILERKISINKINELREEIDYISSGKKVQDYLSMAEPYLETYKELCPEMKKIDFTATESSEEEEKTLQYREKMSVISAFLNLAQQHIPIDIIRKKKSSQRCICGQDLSDVYVDEWGNQECPQCGNERYMPGYNISKKDTIASRNDYSDSGNFKKSFIRYQGKQVDNIPESLFKDLDAYYEARGKPVSKDIQSRPLTRKGRKKGTDLPMLYKALQETGYSSLYEDANLIAHKYWGWKLPDVGHLESLIMNDYKKTQRIYNMLPKDRSSSLGTQFRLFKHLELRGHPCSIDDFKIVKMRESLEFHDETWRQICELCEDPDIYYIPTI